MYVAEFEDQKFLYNHVAMKPMSVSEILPHIHDGYELIYVIAGKPVYTVEEKSYRILPNSLILTRPSKLHFIQFEDMKEYARHIVQFEANVVISSVLAQIPQNVDVVTLGENNSILRLFQKMDKYCKYFEGEELKAALSNMVAQMFYELVIFLQQSDSKPMDMHTVNPTVAAAIEYIDSHMHTDLCLDTLCKELYISKSYLHQLFMRYLQITPRRYIAGKRLLAAQQAIRAGSRPSDIYVRYGFSEYSSFYRAYCKQFGHPPSEELKRQNLRKILF